ncbi:hypothetical protein MN608_04932 [Microdochium nivale]|nr:hypothetical protein MN608_04932 [Microdochium nivale]
MGRDAWLTWYAAVFLSAGLPAASPARTQNRSRRQPDSPRQRRDDGHGSAHKTCPARGSPGRLRSIFYGLSFSPSSGRPEQVLVNLPSTLQPRITISTTGSSSNLKAVTLPRLPLLCRTSSPAAMTLFSIFRLAKGPAKDNGKAAQQGKDETQKPKYVHVPKHAAADAMTGAPPCWSEADRPRILAANQKRISRDASRLSLQSIPRVQSSLSYVSYPASDFAPFATLPRNYSYSSMPGTSTQGSRHLSLADLRRSARQRGGHGDGDDLMPPLPRSSHFKAAAGPSTLYGRGISANTSASSVGSGLVMVSRRQPPTSASTSRDAPGLAPITAGQPSGPGPSITSRPIAARRATTDMILTPSSRPQSRQKGHVRRISPLNPAALGVKPVEPGSVPPSTRSSSSVSSVASASSSIHSQDAMGSTAPSSVARTPDLAASKKEYRPPTGTTLAEALSVGSSSPTGGKDTTVPSRPSRVAFWKNGKRSTKASSDQRELFDITADTKATGKGPTIQDECKQEAKKGRWPWLGKTHATAKV